MLRSVRRNDNAAIALRSLAGSTRGHARPRRGFTLLETMMALVIIGIGVLAFVDAQSAFTQSNNWSSTAGTAMLLANEIREMTRRLPRHDPVTGLWLDGSTGTPVVRGWGSEAGETTAKDVDDIDDLDGKKFGNGGNFAGPIDAYANVIPAVAIDGTIRVDGLGNQVPLEGWSQRVIVQKVDPYNFNTVRAAGYEQVASSQWPAIKVDKFPLKVTVIVEYQSLNDTSPQEITRVSWVVPN